MCAIWKDLRYFSSWCPPSHLQSRTCAGSRLQNGKTVALGTSVQHYLSIAETTTQGYSVVQNPNHLQKYELCLLLAAGSCMKTILLKSDLSRVSNMSSSFCLFFYLAVLKKWSGLIPTVSTILEGRIRPWIIFLKGRDRRLHPTHPYGITVYGQELGIPERKASSTIQPPPVATRISYITFSRWKKKKESDLYCTLSFHKKLWVLPAYCKNMLLLFAFRNGSGSRPTTNSNRFVDNIFFFSCKSQLTKKLCSVIPAQI